MGEAEQAVGKPTLMREAYQTVGIPTNIGQAHQAVGMPKHTRTESWRPWDTKINMCVLNNCELLGTLYLKYYFD